MNHVAYVNGEFCHEKNAKVSIFDRGFLMSDGIYEVTPVIDGVLVDRAVHMQRLERSLNTLGMVAPVPIEKIDRLQEKIMQINNINEGKVYIQVTRGAAERSFVFPEETECSLIMFAREDKVLENDQARDGVKVMTLPDIRWGQRNIKTIMLLPACLAMKEARESGYEDAWFHEDGMITEGTSNNAFIIKDKTIYTRELSKMLLPGCTRHVLFELAAECGYEIVERPFSVEQAMGADEAFLTSAAALITPVIQINEKLVGNGLPGVITKQLRQKYIDHLRFQASLKFEFREYASA